MSRHSEANDPWDHGPVAYAKQEAEDVWYSLHCWCCGEDLDEQTLSSALCGKCADARCDEQDKPGHAHGRRTVPCPRVAREHKCRKCRRDEFSCPCCGAPTDSSYCAACDAAECGERTALEVCRDGCLAGAK